jgi:hypothetical protein
LGTVFGSASGYLFQREAATQAARATERAIAITPASNGTGNGHAPPQGDLSASQPICATCGEPYTTPDQHQAIAGHVPT